MSEDIEMVSPQSAQRQFLGRPLGRRDAFQKITLLTASLFLIGNARAEGEDRKTERNPANNSASSSGFWQAMAIGAPILAGVLGYFIAYWSNWKLEKKKAALDFISDQLQHLYGPLFALNTAGSSAVEALLQYTNRDKYYFIPGQTFDADAIKEYRLWILEVLMPINLKMENIIINSGHLIEGRDMPSEFSKLLAHIAAYKAIIKKWPEIPPLETIGYEQAAHENAAPLPFPREFSDYVEKTVLYLKQRQSILLGQTGKFDTDSGRIVTSKARLTWRDRARRLWGVSRAQSLPISAERGATKKKKTPSGRG